MEHRGELVDSRTLKDEFRKMESECDALIAVAHSFARERGFGRVAGFYFKKFKRRLRRLYR
ncbi:MAG: hypothetical protein HZA04_10850 [Nitrospinae bacterium]|nr:hypothetical protein [Nitrospinota bacterium]